MANESADVFEPRDNGTVYLAWSEPGEGDAPPTIHEVTLRRPKLAEWGAIIDELDAASAWISAEGRSNKDLASDANPYPAAYTSIIERLGGQTFARADLPLWCVDAKVSNRLNVHWLNLPLPRGEQAGTGTS